VKSHLFHVLIIFAASLFISIFIYTVSTKNAIRISRNSPASAFPSTAQTVSEIPFAVITIVPSVEYTYYPIYARTADEIHDQLIGALGTDKDNTPVTAYASWDLNWDYPKIKSNNTCRMGRPVRMLLDVDYTMPKWDPEAGTSPQLIQRWNRFYDRLTMHEQHHIQIAMDTAYETLKQFYSLPSYPTCQALDDAAYTIGRDLKYAAWDTGDAYDDATNHGYNEGAKF
jgi:predicted secreted Zn-dependent protease